MVDQEANTLLPMPPWGERTVIQELGLGLREVRVFHIRGDEQDALRYLEKILVQCVLVFLFLFLCAFFVLYKKITDAYCAHALTLTRFMQFDFLCIKIIAYK